MKLLKLHIFISPEGYRKTIQEIEAKETDKSYIFKAYSGTNSRMAKEKLLKPDSLIQTSHARFSGHIFCLPDQMHEAEVLLRDFIQYQIDRVKAEYEAVMKQVPNEPGEWIVRKDFGNIPAPKGIKL